MDQPQFQDLVTCVEPKTKVGFPLHQKTRPKIVNDRINTKTKFLIMLHLLDRVNMSPIRKKEAFLKKNMVIGSYHSIFFIYNNDKE